MGLHDPLHLTYILWFSRYQDILGACTLDIKVDMHINIMQPFALLFENHLLFFHFKLEKYTEYSMPCYIKN